MRAAASLHAAEAALRGAQARPGPLGATRRAAGAPSSGAGRAACIFTGCAHRGDPRRLGRWGGARTSPPRPAVAPAHTWGRYGEIEGGVWGRYRDGGGRDRGEIGGLLCDGAHCRSKERPCCSSRPDEAKAENPRLWGGGGLGRAAEAIASLRAAQAVKAENPRLWGGGGLLRPPRASARRRRGSGASRRGVSRHTRQGGEWSAVLRRGRRPILLTGWPSRTPPRTAATAPDRAAGHANPCS